MHKDYIYLYIHTYTNTHIYLLRFCFFLLLCFSVYVRSVESSLNKHKLTLIRTLAVFIAELSIFYVNTQFIKNECVQFTWKLMHCNHRQLTMFFDIFYNIQAFYNNLLLIYTKKPFILVFLFCKSVHSMQWCKKNSFGAFRNVLKSNQFCLCIIKQIWEK